MGTSKFYIKKLKDYEKNKLAENKKWIKFYLIDHRNKNEDKWAAINSVVRLRKTFYIIGPKEIPSFVGKHEPKCEPPWVCA